jgi:hypothetical protein
MALDTLSIPSMSAECERILSSTKKLLTDSRNGLQEEIIEATECLKACAMKGSFSSKEGVGEVYNSELPIQAVEISIIVGFHWFGASQESQGALSSSLPY